MKNVKLIRVDLIKLYSNNFVIKDNKKFFSCVKNTNLLVAKNKNYNLLIYKTKWNKTLFLNFNVSKIIKKICDNNFIYVKQFHNERS